MSTMAQKKNRETKTTYIELKAALNGGRNIINMYHHSCMYIFYVCPFFCRIFRVQVLFGSQTVEQEKKIENLLRLYDMASRFP